MRKIYITLIYQLLFVFNARTQYNYPYQDPDGSLEERIDNLLSLLTLVEKLSWMDQHQPAITRLDIPYFTTWTEGLHGLAWAQTGTVTATHFPQAKGLANTWSPETVQKAGYVEGYEARVYFKKYHGDGIGLVIRVPMVDMGRDVRWGRTEENLGEDPFLVGEIGKGMVSGLQGNDQKYLMTASILKHFLANNNETNRDRASLDFDERNLREYYLAPFRECMVNGDARYFMTAYNLINEIPATVTPLINDIVRRDWGFNGMICTDAYAFYNLTGSQHYYTSSVTAAAGAVHAGINVFVDYDKNALKNAYNTGLISENEIDRVIRGNVRLRFQLGLFDPPGSVPWNNVSAVSDPWKGEAHKKIVLEVAEKSLVLLKNEGAFLPLHMDSIQSIAVIGPNANDVFRDWYGGYPPYKVSVLKGLQNRTGDSIAITYAADNAGNQAVTAAETSDIAIVCIGNHPTCGNDNWADCSSDYQGRETHDRKYIEPEPSQLELVKNVYAANKKTIVILISGFPQAITWIQDSVVAVLHITHSCQELGNAVARALFGDVNPGGKTVFTWLSGTGELPDLYDYNIRNSRTYMFYEGEPLYPFGYGLSYTTFDFTGLAVANHFLGKDDTLKLYINVKNTGKLAGDEVAELYVRYLNSSVERPVKELRAFKRISLPIDSSVIVDFSVPVSRLSYWNEKEQSFYVEEGDIELQLGNSSASTFLRDTIHINEGGNVRIVPKADIPSMFTISENRYKARVLYQSGIPVLELNLVQESNIDLAIYNMIGILIDHIPVKNLSSGRHEIQLNTLIGIPGMFILKGLVNKHILTEKFIVERDY